ncbi:unnamed protein product [Heterobilharzia americana]|nr:unnamed protein product [Heterobilharzia americana]
MSVKRHSLDDIGLDRENREHFKKHKNAKWPSCLSSEVPYVKSDCNGGLHQRSNSERKRPANRMSLNKVKKKFLGKAVSESKGCVDEAELKNCVPKLLITSLPRTVNSTALKMRSR